jgi:hypothetical protein
MFKKAKKNQNPKNLRIVIFNAIILPYYTKSLFM